MKAMLEELKELSDEIHYSCQRLLETKLDKEQKNDVIDIDYNRNKIYAIFETLKVYEKHYEALIKNKRENIKQ